MKGKVLQSVIQSDRLNLQLVVDLSLKTSIIAFLQKRKRTSATAEEERGTFSRWLNDF